MGDSQPGTAGRGLVLSVQGSPSWNGLLHYKGLLLLLLDCIVYVLPVFTLHASMPLLLPLLLLSESVSMSVLCVLCVCVCVCVCVLRVLYVCVCVLCVCVCVCVYAIVMFHVLDFSN